MSDERPDESGTDPETAAPAGAAASDAILPGDAGAEGAAARPSMDRSQLEAIVEALVFASPEPLTPKMLFKLLADEPKEDITATLQALKTEYESRPGLQFVEVA